METKKVCPAIVEKTLFSWVFSGRLSLKIALLLTILVTVFTRVFPLEMQKRIFNLAINGRLELGALVAFLSAQEKVFDPWRELIDFYQSYQEASVSYSRTMEFFDERPEFAIEPIGRKPAHLTGNIEINNLSFTTEEGIQLLDKINFRINNIFFGRLKTTNPHVQDTINEQVVQLLIEEGILETVVEIGMQFQVGSKGDRLSGGQRQKLAIARALLKKPRILIMDEATSALDNKSQNRIQTLLDTRWKGKATLIAVVHRLDIIKNFDKIGLMKSGKVEEIGTYEELMTEKGLLYELATGGR